MTEHIYLHLMHLLHKVHEVNVLYGGHVRLLLHMLHSKITPCMLMKVISCLHQMSDKFDFSPYWSNMYCIIHEPQI